METNAVLTYEKLAEVAQARRIHTWFEQAWARGMNGINPVFYAIKAVNTKKEKEDRDFKLKVTGAIGVTCVLAMLTIVVLSPYFAKLWQSFPIEKVIATYVLIAITGALLLAEFLFTALTFQKELDKKILEVDTAMTNAFCADLQVFINGMEMDIDSWFNWSLCADMKQHEFMAFNILVRMAKQVLLVQASISADDQIDKYEAMQNGRVIHKGKLMEELEKKYNALQRIGMISGGYKKIFEEAAKLITSAANTQS